MRPLFFSVYIILQGLALTVHAAPVGNGINIRTAENPAQARALQARAHEDRRTIKETVSSVINALQGHTSSSGNSGTASDSSQDTSASTAPPAKRTASGREDRRTIKEKVSSVINAIRGHTSSSGDSSTTSPNSSQESVSTAPPGKRSSSGHADRRTIREKVSSVINALKGHSSSSADSGDSSTSSSEPSQDTSASTTPPARRSLPRRRIPDVTG